MSAHQVNVNSSQMLHSNSDHRQSGLPAYLPAELPRSPGVHLNDSTESLSTADRDTLPTYDELLGSGTQCPATRSSVDSKDSTRQDEKVALAVYYDERNSDHISQSSTSSARSAAPGSIALKTTKTNFLANFLPTVQLQIETRGKQWLSSPLLPRAEPILVFPLVLAQRHLVLAPRPAYVSVRPSRDTGSSLLMTGDQFTTAYSKKDAITATTTATSSDETPADTVPCPAPEIGSTAYRFGPARRPLVSVIGRGRTDGKWRRFKFLVQSKGVATRAVEFEPRCFLSSLQGDDGGVVEDKFTWRHAGITETVVDVGRFLEAVHSASGGSVTSDSGKEKGKSRDKPARPNSVLVLERSITTTTTITTTVGTAPAIINDKLKDKTYPSSVFSRLHRPKMARQSLGPEITTRKHTVTHVVALFVRSDKLRSPGSSAQPRELCELSWERREAVHRPAVLSRRR